MNKTANMKIEQVSIDKIKPYGRNAKKHPQDQIDAVAKSIEQFGWKQPIVIDKKGEIIIGHCRWEAAKALELETVPCVVASDLSSQQIKALRLADNKKAELAEYDFDILNEELADIIDIDMTDFGFEINMDDAYEDDDDGYYGDARERTVDHVNLDDFDRERCAGRFQMPILTAEKYVPKDLISFNYMLTSTEYNKGIHFYIDDYQFERVWNAPHDYIAKMKKFDCCLTPDFSLYMEMPIAMQIWNIYRSRLIGQIMQDYGIKVIPTLSWTTEDSFEFCFDGIEQGGTVSVSTIGVKRNDEASKIWFLGMDEAMDRLKPSHVVVYGGDIGYDFGDCGVSYIANHNSERFKGLLKDEES